MTISTAIWCDGSAEGRKKTPEQVRATIDQGPFLSTHAQEQGLVDGLLYEDQMYGEVKAKVSGISRRFRCADYLRVPPVGPEGKQRIALVTGQGDISSGR